MKLNLLVIKTADPASLTTQYEALGLHFEYHQHGTGPFHYAAEIEDLIFEIYPLPAQLEQADHSLRLGFEVTNLDQQIAKLRTSNWKILSPAKETAWGRIALIQDLDGRKVELKEI